MKCPECKAEVSEDSQFCSKCGASLSVDLESLSPTRTMLGHVLHLKKGQIIGGKYKIIQKIGEGGMGIVYKAEDTKLKRNVALKFLPSELTRDKKAKSRFIQEAQAAAALNHPHICIIHEVDESDDQTFIAMEFIEGKTLKDMIEAGPLAIDEAIDIASQVAEGLGEAHKKGIVHRDIKPANIMLTEKGQAKIMDFGLAKLSWGADLTKPSMIMGTVAYMSPEQARGEPVDHRTDIWSLGAMLYEMLTGEKPFQKSHEQALIFSILRDELESLSSLRPEVPRLLENTIRQAMEKDANKRYQNVDDFIEAMKHPGTVAIPQEDKSIAVLPFANMSNDPEQEYFCEGIAEELLNSLTKLKDLRVVARTSAFLFKGQNVKIQDIGNQLNVRYVLEGSVRKSANRLRVTAQLINAADGYRLWSDRYDRNLEDIFAIQDEISLAIVDKLKLKLFKEEKAELIKHHTRDIEVYNLYLRGRYHWQRFTVEDVRKSQEYFEQAIERDPDYASPYAALAGGVYMQLAGGGQDILPPKEIMPKARVLLEKALEKDPNNGEALSYMGLIKTWYDYDWAAAEEVLKRAIDVDPGSVFSHNGYAFFLAQTGRHDESIREQTEAIELDPLSPLMYNNAGYFYYVARQYDQALKHCQLALDFNPLLPPTHWVLGLIHIQKNNYEKAIELIKPLVSVSTYTYGYLGYAYGKAKMKREARELLEILKGLEETYQVDPLFAMVFCGLGEFSKALDCLERSTRKPPISWPKRGFVVAHGMLGVDPIWDPLHKDERFIKILEKVGLACLVPAGEDKAATASADTSPAKDEGSIVVLPFNDVSPGKDNEYFSDGLTDEIISDLSKIRSLRVISRTSAMMLKGTHKSMKAIRRELDVRYVLEGSVRKAGNNLRITTQLIDAKTDAHLWAEKYSGTLDDVFEIQEKVSHSIADSLKMKLSAEEKKGLAERPFKDVKAYECYLKAKYEIDAFTKEGVERAIQHLESGLKIIGESAILYAGLGYAYWQYFNIEAREKYLEKGLGYARKALELDPDSSEAHFITGNLYFFHGVPRDIKKIIFHLKKALALDPNNCEALFHLQVVYLFSGKTAAAASLIKRHLNIDPLSSYGLWSDSMFHLFEGRLAQALEPIEKAYQLARGVPPIAFSHALILAYNDRLEDAFSIIDQSQKAAPDHVFSQIGITWKYALQGKKEEALRSITPQMLGWGRIDFTSPWFLAGPYSLVGETEEALNWMEQGVNLGCINYPFLNEYDRFIENIRGEPRFKKLMERVKHEWENFEV